MTRPVCPGCNTIHPDLNLPKKRLAMDTRDIHELIVILNERAAESLKAEAESYGPPAARGFDRGYAAGAALAAGLLTNYLAAS